MKTSVKTLALELFGKGMNTAQAFEEITRQGLKAKKGTIAAYYSTRNAAPAATTISARGEKKRATVTKSAATLTGARKAGRTATRQAAATRGGLNRTDVIDWVYNNSNLVAAKKREIASLILN